MQRQYVALGFAGIAVILIASLVGGAVAFAPGQDAPTRATQQQAGACDYEQLFDDVDDAVVSVQTAAGQGSGFVVETGDDGTNGSLIDAPAAQSESNAAQSGPNSSQTGANASYLLTNAHVVGSADEVTVQFGDGEYRSGTVLGRSTYADLAVVSVPDAPGYVTSLDVATDDPERGVPVAAVGSPFGLQETITHGIVSGVNRSMPTDLGFSIPNVVQTDAPISPGNSGGPLLTCDGTVVGVNTAGIPSPRAENIGFAISPSVVQAVVPDLVTNGSFDYPFLGVATRPVTPAVAEVNDLNETRGIMVVSTLDGGPATDVLEGRSDVVSVDGQRVPLGGDVILSIDGQDVSSGEDLASYLITETEPGETVELEVVRDGERQTVEVTIGERPDPGSA